MTILTKAQSDAQNFLRYAFGETPVGSAENESVDRAYSPELRAFFHGRIGPVPSVWWINTLNLGQRPQEIEARKNLAEILREIADTLFPEEG